MRDTVRSDLPENKATDIFIRRELRASLSVFCFSSLIEHPRLVYNKQVFAARAFSAAKPIT